jgi:hypothetical protein
MGVDDHRPTRLYYSSPRRAFAVTAASDDLVAVERMKPVQDLGTNSAAAGSLRGATVPLGPR